MPVYYCGACDKLIVEESRPGNCSRCDSTEIKDDPEVLAPWFTSILLSLLILGRDKKSADFTVFYPADIMAAGLDIVFSWVVRMIAIGIHLGKDIPVREVLINGAVRDGKGQKVKEENPNSINPLGIIGDYGADALRFTLAAQAVPGMDTSFSINRIKGYKSFINKIWHASRFTLLNLKGDETFDFDASKITTADKWMLHNLNKTIEKINVLLDQYRVNKAADLLYRFFRHEYCDWYLEFSRKDTGKEDTGKVLKFVLFKLLQLLHPFTPFITEEIYQRIKSRENFLLQTEFPSFNSDLMFYDEFAGIELLKKVIKQTRKIRMENKIDPNRRIPIYLKTGSEKERVILAKQLKYFNFLTGSAGTEIVPGFEGLPKGFKGVCPNWEILLPCECDEDRLSEMNRLKKELKEMEDRVGDFETKLTEEELKSGTSKREMAKIKKGLQASISKKEKIKKAVDDLS
jgi:valyl-tRNA synthetase